MVYLLLLFDYRSLCLVSNVHLMNFFNFEAWLLFYFYPLRIIQIVTHIYYLVLLSFGVSTGCCHGWEVVTKVILLLVELWLLYIHELFSNQLHFLVCFGFSVLRLNQKLCLMLFNVDFFFDYWFNTRVCFLKFSSLGIADVSSKLLSCLIWCNFRIHVILLMMTDWNHPLRI